MKKKKMSKSSKRSLLFFGTISLVVIGYFVYNLFLYTYNIYVLKKQEIELTESLNKLEHESKILKTEIEKLQDPVYIARYARENYQYSKDGEIIIQLYKDAEAETEDKIEEDYNYIIIIGGSVIVLLVGYVFIKNKKRK